MQNPKKNQREPKWNTVRHVFIMPQLGVTKHYGLQNASDPAGDISAGLVQMRAWRLPLAVHVPRALWTTAPPGDANMSGQSCSTLKVTVEYGHVGRAH